MVFSIKDIVKMEFWKDRLKERSTYRGIFIALGVIGVKLNPDQIEAIITALCSVWAVVEVLSKDKNVKKEATDAIIQTVKPDSLITNKLREGSF